MAITLFSFLLPLSHLFELISYKNNFRESSLFAVQMKHIIGDRQQDLKQQYLSLAQICEL